MSQEPDLNAIYKDPVSKLGHVLSRMYFFGGRHSTHCTSWLWVAG